MRKEIVLPVTAGVCGAVGFALRRWELSAAFEADTGLPVPGAPASIAVMVFSVLVFVVLLALCRMGHRPFSGGYDVAFAAKGNTLYASVMVLSAFLLLASAGLNLWYFVRRENTMATRLVLAALCVAACVCVVATARNNLRGEGKGKYSFTLLMPAYTCCMWLIVAYQARAADPVILDYVYELFAIIAVLLGLYFIAGFSFERPKVRRAAFFSLLGVYFSILTLADAHSLPDLLLYGFAILYLIANTVVMLANVRRCPPEENTEREGLPDES